MKQLLFSTENHLVGFILRLTAAGVMLPHGMQKMFGSFGGYGYKATIDYFINTMQLPRFIAVMVIAIEFFGPVFLLVGLGSKLWAMLLIVIMLGAIITTNYTNGFFMNWFGNQAGEGYEYHILFIGLCLAIVAGGSGAFSVDSLI